MGFGQAVTACMVKFADFSGRASRSEFWWFYLFAFLTIVGAVFVGGLAFPADPMAAEMVPAVMELFFIVPVLAAGARRLHDIGRSGWWLLLIPTVVGIVPLVVFWVLASERGRNAHGAPSAGAAVRVRPGPPRSGR